MPAVLHLSMPDVGDDDGKVRRVKVRMSSDKSGKAVLEQPVQKVVVIVEAE